MPFRPRARTGHDIFEILVRENADMLTAYLRSSLPHSTDVDDLFQETMAIAWRRLDDYDRARPFGPWLRGIARNLVLAHYRKLASAPHWCTPAVLEALDVRFDSITSQPGDTFREQVGALANCIEQLSDKLRRIIDLAYGRGMSYKEVGLALEQTEPTVRKGAQRAREQLHRCLQHAGVV